MFSGRFWVLDGGLGSALQNSGYSIDDDPLWSARLLATNPKAIKKVHRDYLEAGADIITTSSYQASINGFSKHLGMNEDQTKEHMKRSIQLAREAIDEYVAQHPECGRRPLIAGSIGPYGACQADGSEYNGEYVSNMQSEELIEWHRPRVEALIDAKVDVLAIETIPSLKEALAIITLLQSFPNTKAWVTFSCKDPLKTNYGDDFGNAVKKCYEQGKQQLVAVGVNCSPPQYITSLLEQANRNLPPSSHLPRIVYPNSGETWIPGKGWEESNGDTPISPGDWPFVSDVPVWHSLGASIIGGCCRLGPSAVKAIRNSLSSISE